MSTATPPARKLDYHDAAHHCHDTDYATHARRLIECLSDGISWVRLKAEVGMMNEEVADTTIETHTYLLKESRVIGAIGISEPAITKRPDSRGFQMSNMYGQTEEVFGKSYDKGHHVCHGGGGGTDRNLFPQLRSLNRDWSDEGKLYRQMKVHVVAHPGTRFFSMEWNFRANNSQKFLPSFIIPSHWRAMIGML